MINSSARSALEILEYDYQVSQHIAKSKAKRPRCKPGRTRGCLADQANGLFLNKPGKVFVNPTDSQLDRIYNGQLWGCKS